MVEWEAVVISGVLGGFVGTFLPGGTDVPFPEGIRRVIGTRTWLEVLLMSYAIPYSGDWQPFFSGPGIVLGKPFRAAM
jgi:hypothetical protein